MSHVTINTSEQIVRVTLNEEGEPIRAVLRENAIIIQKGGIRVGTVNAINFIEGSNVTLTYTNDADGVTGNLTITAAGGSGSGVSSFNGRTGAVIPAQSDYDSFFLTSTEGDAAYTAKLATANRQTASYTLALTDVDKLVEMNVGSANNLTVPPNSSVAFSTGTQILVSQYGAGQTTIVAGSGVTLRSAGGALKLRVQYSGATLVKIATDEWYVFGDITT